MQSFWGTILSVRPIFQAVNHQGPFQYTEQHTANSIEDTPCATIIKMKSGRTVVDSLQLQI